MRISDWSSDVCSSDLPRDDRRVDLFGARQRALYDIIEKFGVGVGIFGVLDRRADAVLMEFVDQLGHGSALHLMLIERLDGGKASGGAGLGAFVPGFSTSIYFGRRSEEGRLGKECVG